MPWEIERRNLLSSVQLGASYNASSISLPFCAFLVAHFSEIVLMAFLIGRRYGWGDNR